MSVLFTRDETDKCSGLVKFLSSCQRPERLRYQRFASDWSWRAHGDTGLLVVWDSSSRLTKTERSTSHIQSCYDQIWGSIFRYFARNHRMDALWRVACWPSPTLWGIGGSHSSQPCLCHWRHQGHPRPGQKLQLFLDWNLHEFWSVQANSSLEACMIFSACYL